MPVRAPVTEQEGLIRLPNRHMQVAHLEADRVSHMFFGRDCRDGC